MGRLNISLTMDLYLIFFFFVRTTNYLSPSERGFFSPWFPIRSSWPWLICLSGDWHVWGLPVGRTLAVTPAGSFNLPDIGLHS